jgi:hypothetical protein
MKNAIIVLGLFLSITVCCAGCGNNINGFDNQDVINCYILSLSNVLSEKSESNFSMAEEAQWWNGVSFSSEVAPREMTIEFAGKEYSGTYRNSRYDSYNSFATDYYDGEDGLIFGINSSNEEIVYINLKTLSFFEEEPRLDDNEHIESEGIEFAKAYASMLANIDGYTLLPPYVAAYQPDSGEPTMMLYTYTFTKQIADEVSSAYVSVQLTSKGNLASIVVGDIGAFSDPDIVQFCEGYFSNVDVDALVSKQVTNICRNVDLTGLEVQNKYYAMTPEGQVVMCVRATCTYSEYEEKFDGEESAGVPVQESFKAGFEFVLK